MPEKGETEERLREALLELNLLREREASALRQSNALLDGLARMTGAVSPAKALDDLLASARTSLGCDAAFVIEPGDTGARVVQSTQPELMGVSLPPELLHGSRTRRVADLSLVRWWRDVSGLAADLRSLLCVSINLPDGSVGGLVGASYAHARFSAAEQDMMTRLAGLASQALATLALAERNALLAAVIDGSSASVTIADATSDAMPLIYVNHAFTDLSGYPPGEILGANCRFLSAEPPDSQVRAEVRNTVQARGAGSFDVRNRRKNGEEFWNRLTLYPVNGSDGQTSFMVATQVDITAERQAAQERDAARQRLIGALSATSEGFLLLDPAGNIVVANPQYRDFFETRNAAWREGDAFVETFCAMLVDQGADKATARQRARARRDKLFTTRESREERLDDGRVLLVNDQATADGGAVSIATDITSLKATERILLQRAAAIDSAQDGIAVTDMEGRFVYMNPSHLAMFGFEGEAEVLGRSWSELYRPDQAEYIERVGMPELQRNGVWRGEVTGISRNGETVYQEISLTFLKDVGIVCVTRDIWERHRNLRERERLQEQLQAAQRQEAIGLLAAGVAHDFNNLLSAINGSAALLSLDLDKNDPSLAHVQRIEAAGERASELVGRLIAVGARQQKTERVDLVKPFEEAAELLRAGLRSRVTLSVHAPDRPMIADADQTSFLQVVLNLGINARDAIGAGKGEITLALEEAIPRASPADVLLGTVEPQTIYAKLTVGDTGSGMKPGVKDQIFRPYYSTKGDDGTGLGLAVVASIVKAVGGAARVSSSLGTGTEFEIWWPTRASVKAPHRSSLTRAPPATPGPTALSGHTILVCDDAEAVGEVISGCLEQSGAETAACTHPGDALEAITDDPSGWSLLITDFDMPDMDGAALAREVRKIAPHLPILLCTAVEQGVAAPALFDAVLKKPIEPDSLIATAEATIVARNAEVNEPEAGK